MMFQFDSLYAFWRMTGAGQSVDHGRFVWAAYGITLVALLGLVISSRRRRSALIEKAQRQAHQQTISAQTSIE